MRTIEEAKVVKMAKLNNALYRLEAIHKKMTEVEAEFNELKRELLRIEGVEAEARAIFLQYEVELRTPNMSCWEHAIQIENIIGAVLEDVDQKIAAKAYMADKSEEL